jgi:2-methylcitrate dehydratase
MKLTRRRVLHLGAGATALPIAVAMPAILASQHAEAANGAPPLARRLADYALGLRYEDLDQATIERVRIHLIDSLGCGIAALNEGAVRICREIALPVSGPSTVIGTTSRTTAELAAFANGAAIRYLDFNDTYAGKTFAVHPSDNIAPCLAVAEVEHASAHELITAIVIAYEVNCRLTDAFDISARGWTRRFLACPRWRSRPGG